MQQNPQEQWTLDRLTINAGLRYDYETSSYPDQIVPAATWQPFDLFIDGQTSNGWHDIQPRIGIAYDLLGDGKTAVKLGFHRYGKRNATDVAKMLNPSLNNRSHSRSYFDGGDPFGIGAPACIGPIACIAGDGLVQGDALNPAPNGELLNANTNPAFGQPVINTAFDQNWAFRYGQRPANWEISASIQQELRPGLSLDVGYFRRSWMNFWTETDRAVGPGDFDQFDLVVPLDPNLPGGGGNTISLFDINPEAVTARDTLFVSANDLGGESETWQGFDITVDGRLENLLIQGGVSTGAGSLDNCDVQAAAPETAIVNRPRRGSRSALTPFNYCDTTQNWLTQVKFLGSYTLPYDIQIAATLQNQPGIERIAEMTYSQAALTAALGRPHTASSITVDVIEPGSVYGERFSQFDLRFTKIFTFAGGTRLRTMFDIFNLFNANAITRESPDYGAAGAGGLAWRAPQVIMAGRLAKFAFQFDF